jgi:hypothetical protein
MIFPCGLCLGLIPVGRHKTGILKLHIKEGPRFSGGNVAKIQEEFAFAGGRQARHGWCARRILHEHRRDAGATKNFSEPVIAVGKSFF